MKNTVDIKSDGINVYITSNVQANKKGKIVLTILNSSVLIFYIWFISSLKNEEAGKFLVPVVLMFIMFVFFPWRYWFWNFFGKEIIIINTKTITRHYHYGILQTNPKTLPHNRLATTYEFVRNFENEEFGRLHFISYNIDTNLPEALFQTSVIIPKKAINRIEMEIQNVFNNENLNNISFSVN